MHNDEALNAAHDTLNACGVRRGQYWRHVKTGGVYRVLTFAVIEATIVPAVVYEDDSGTWVRPLAEFLDGRFERVAETGGTTSLTRKFVTLDLGEGRTP